MGFRGFFQCNFLFILLSQLAALFSTFVIHPRHLVRSVFFFYLINQRLIRVLNMLHIAVCVTSLTVRGFLLFACTVKRGSEVGSVSNTAMGPPPASTYCWNNNLRVNTFFTTFSTNAYSGFFYHRKHTLWEDFSVWKLGVYLFIYFLLGGNKLARQQESCCHCKYNMKWRQSSLRTVKGGCVTCQAQIGCNSLEPSASMLEHDIMITWYCSLLITARSEVRMSYRETSGAGRD